MQQVKQQFCTCRIPSLNHETFNISVEDAVVVEPTGTQSHKVLQRVKICYSMTLFGENIYTSVLRPLTLQQLNDHNRCLQYVF